MPLADNVLVAATGALYVADLGTTAPVDAEAAWGVGWAELGYLSEDGITENAALDSEEIAAWQSGAVVRTVITGSRLQFGFTVIETNLTTLELFYPGSVVTQVVGPPAESHIEIKLPVAVPKAFGFDVVDGTKLERIVVPRAELFERGERNYQNAAARGYPMTLAASPDSTGTTAIRMLNPQVAAL